MLSAKNKALGTWMAVTAGILALISSAIYFAWAPNHNAFHSIIPITLVSGAVADILLFFLDISYLGVAATTLLSIAFFNLLSDSVGSFVDAMKGIVMFGDSSQVGIIITISALILMAILLTILSCFMKRRK